MHPPVVRRTVALVATLLACSLPGVAGLSAAPAAAGGEIPGVTEVPLRVGTYNIEGNRSQETFEAAVTAFKPRVDVAGLQEITGHVRNNWLLADTTWRIFRGDHIGQVSVIWRPEVLEFVSGREVRLTKAATIEGNGGKLIHKKADWAPVVRLRHVATGELVSVMSVHLLHGAINVGLPDRKKPRAVAYYVKQVAKLRRVVAGEMEAGFRPYVTGDFNIGYEADAQERYRKFPYRKLGSLGLKSMWKGQPLEPHGTHIDRECPPKVEECGAYLDGVWTIGKPDEATVATDIERSDHYPAIGLYSLPHDPAYVPTTGTVGFRDAALSIKEEDRPYQVREPLRFQLEGNLAHGFVRVEVDGITATEGQDFTVDSSSLFDNDLSDNHVDVYRIGDKTQEPDETFVLRLVDPANTTITLGQAVGTILDDD